MSQKDEKARLRAEAKRFREHAKSARADVKRCKAAGDWVGKLKAECRVTEYVRDAQGREEMARRIDV